MKAFVQRTYSRTPLIKVVEWGRLITITGSAQIAVQALSLISGILIIRLLPTREYALYTLANTILGTMTVLSDGGIASSVMAQGGQVWHDKVRFGKVFATGLYLRQRFAVGSLLVACPFLLFFLKEHDASWIVCALIIFSLIPAFYTSLSNSLLQIPSRLAQNITPLQKVEVGTSLRRLTLLCVLLFVFPYSYIAILAAGIPQLFANAKLRKISDDYLDLNQLPDPYIKQNILKAVKRMLPSLIYYCLSGQITIWLISLFGTTTGIAQLGALGRVALIINILSILVSTLLIPRFARQKNESALLLKRFLQIQVFLLVSFTLATVFCWKFSDTLLDVLGESYNGLNVELVLNLIGCSLFVLAGVITNICSSRGWINHPLITIPVSILSIVVGIITFDIATLKGVLMLNLFLGMVQVVMNGMYALYKIYTVKPEC